MPSLSNILNPSFANSSLFLAVALGISLSTWFNLSPASAPLTPLSAKAAKTATPSSISFPTTFKAAPAFVVNASENCWTLALAKVLAFTNTSVTLVKFSKFFSADETVNPNADCASVAKSVAVAISNIPACANFATWGSAATDCWAFKPADAKKKNASADCSAPIRVVLEVCKAASSIFCCSATVVFIIAKDWFILSSKAVNSWTALDKPLAKPSANAIPASFTALLNLPMPPADLLPWDPIPESCLLANSAPLVTIFIAISAIAII